MPEAASMRHSQTGPPALARAGQRSQARAHISCVRARLQMSTRRCLYAGSWKPGWSCGAGAGVAGKREGEAGVEEWGMEC